MVNRSAGGTVRVHDDAIGRPEILDRRGQGLPDLRRSPCPGPVLDFFRDRCCLLIASIRGESDWLLMPGLWRFVLVGWGAAPFDPAGVVEESFDVVGEPCPAEELEEVVIVVGEADDLVADRDVPAACG